MSTDEKHSKNERDDETVGRGRKGYSRPRLVSYGDVRDLTMGSSIIDVTESGATRKETSVESGP
jgi:hypothetical protein